MILRGGTAPVAQNDPPWPARVEHLARPGGMIGLGMNIVTLNPGQRSSERHWHSHSDEALFVLNGHLTVIEDDGVRIEELRVRGQTQRLVVRPKVGGKAVPYEIIPADGARNMVQGAGASRGAAGQRVWNVLDF